MTEKLLRKNENSAPVGFVPVYSRKDPTTSTLMHPGRLINHRKKRGRNLLPVLLEIDGSPEIFFKVAVDLIPAGKQICYDYGDTRKFDSSYNLDWLKNRNESSDDEGKAVQLKKAIILTQLI